jgi:hypothetical protein
VTTRFTVTVRAKVERASEKQIAQLLREIPHALFDPMRRVLVQTSVVRSEGERSAQDKAVRRVTWALDDAGVPHRDYTIESSVAALPDHEDEE